MDSDMLDYGVLLIAGDHCDDRIASVTLPPNYRLERQLFDVRIYDEAGALIVIADTAGDLAQRAAWFQWHRAFGGFERPMLDVRAGQEDGLDEGAKRALGLTR